MKAKLGFRRMIATILVAAITIGFAPAILGNNTVAASGETVIDSVEISGVTLPVAGASPSVEGITTNSIEAGYTVEYCKWYRTDGYAMVDSETFEPGKVYKLGILLKPTSSTCLPNNVKTDIALIVNGTSYLSEDSYNPGTACIWENSYGLNISVYYQAPGMQCSV